MDRFVATSRSAQRSGTVIVILAALGGALLGAALVYFLVPSPAPVVEPSTAAPAPAAPAAEIALTDNTKEMYRAEIDRLLDVEQKLKLELEDLRINGESTALLERRVVDLEAENRQLRQDLAQNRHGLEAAVDVLNSQSQRPGSPSRSSSSSRSNPPPPPEADKPFVYAHQPWLVIHAGRAEIEGEVKNMDASRTATGALVLRLFNGTDELDSTRITMELGPGLSAYTHTFRHPSIQQGSAGYNITAEWVAR